MEVDTYLAPINNPTGFSNPKHDKPSSNGISAKGNTHALKRHNAMATLADVAVEEQESACVQQELEVLFHQLCVLFGLLIMLLLTESTLYWLNRIWTPRPPNKRALLLGRINNWWDEVKVNDGEGTPPNTLASNSLTSGTADPPSSTAPSLMTKATTVSSAASGVAAAGKVALIHDEDKGNAQPSAALPIRKVAGKHPSKVGLYSLISLILHSFLGHPAHCASHRPGRE